MWSKEDLRDAANKDFGETEDKVHCGNHFFYDIFNICMYDRLKCLSHGFHFIKSGLRVFCIPEL